MIIKIVNESGSFGYVCTSISYLNSESNYCYTCYDIDNQCMSLHWQWKIIEIKELGKERSKHSDTRAIHRIVSIFFPNQILAPEAKNEVLNLFHCSDVRSTAISS